MVAQADTQTEQRWSRSILLVEDDEDFRLGLAELLRSEGYLVACAANGLEALEYLRSGAKPDGAMCDAVNGPGCLDPAVCSGGVCKLPDPSSCK